MPDHRRRAEFGDFQTPKDLAQEALRSGLSERCPATIVEPTCGWGTFLLAGGEKFPQAELLGYEVNPEYVERARVVLREFSDRVTIQEANFFSQDWERLTRSWREPVLVLGNPPWVTSSALGALSSNNLPQKGNAAGLSGMDARTGKSNFDVSEWMIVRLLEALEGKDFSLRMLCKSAVARRIMEHVSRRRWSLAGQVWQIDSGRHFGATVDAVLLGLERSDAPESSWPIYSTLSARTAHRRMAFVNGIITNDRDAFDRTSRWMGRSEPEWRSGIKHDCVRVMELCARDTALFNGLGQVVDVEDDCLFPLLKGSDVANSRAAAHRRVLVPQTKLGQDTHLLRTSAPKTWTYLNAHRARFEGRKSSIYRGQPSFSVFGVGDYTFAPFKVAICGLYKRLQFRIVAPHEGKPVVFDDTVYFLPFETEAKAQQAFDVLTSSEAVDFFEARIFWDAKRPINKSILQSFALQRLFQDMPSSGGSLAALSLPL